MKLKQCSCGVYLTTTNTIDHGYKHLGSALLHWFSCKGCKSTGVKNLTKDATMSKFNADRSFPLNRLFFKYIHGTELKGKITVEQLSALLEHRGFIKISDDGERYQELKDFEKLRYRSRAMKLIQELINEAI